MLMQKYGACEFQAAVSNSSSRGSCHGQNFVLYAVQTEPVERVSELSLSQNLARVQEHLDFANLNEFFEVESLPLAELTELIRKRFDLVGSDLALIPHPRSLLWSYESSGYLMMQRTRLESAHRLPKVGEDHKCYKLHGHGFEIDLYFTVNSSECLGSQQINGASWWLVENLHHKYLNEIEGLENPTSEILSSWIFERLGSHCENLKAVRVWETESSGSLYLNDELHYSFKSFDMQSALQEAPHGIFGHSYKVGVVLGMPLDHEMGWTIDFARIKEQFEPLRKRLDHQDLSSIEGENLSNDQDLVRWIYFQSKDLIPGLKGIELRSMPGFGVRFGELSPVSPWSFLQGGGL